MNNVISTCFVVIWVEGLNVYAWPTIFLTMPTDINPEERVRTFSNPFLAKKYIAEKMPSLEIEVAS